MSALEIAQLALRVALAAAFIGMGILHFLPKGRRTMQAMIPPRLRMKPPLDPHGLVIISGLAEIAGGIGLLMPWEWLRLAAGVGLVLLLIAVFPANAYAATRPDKFGALAVPHLPRLIGQIVLVALVVAASLPLTA